MTVITQLIKELRNKTGAGVLECKKALEYTKNNVKEAIIFLYNNGIIKAAKKSNRIALEGLVDLEIKDNKIVIFEVNSETDFVVKNKKFLDLIKIIKYTLMNNTPKTIEEALKIFVKKNETLENFIANNISIIGENIILRRFEIINLKERESVGFYLHSNNRIATVLIFDGKINKNIAKQLAMHVSAMRPKFISRDDIPVNFLNSKKEFLVAQVKNDPKNINKSDNILMKIVEDFLNNELKEITFLDQIFIINPKQKINDIIKINNIKIINMIRYEVGEFL